jgi:VanZ family protein
MALIFGGSTDLLAEHRTSRFIGPILRWLAPGISDLALDRAHFVVRKTAHFTEYAILALLVWRALSRTKHVPGDSRDGQLAGGRRGKEASASPEPAANPPPPAVEAAEAPVGAVARWPAARLAALSLLVCSLYALSDELHQAFLPARQASLWDVLLDCAGAAGGLVLVGWVRRRRWGSKK